MKILILVLAFALTGCATHTGTDGRTYAWIKPIPSEGTWTAPANQGVTVKSYTINGRGYQVIAPK